MPANNLITEIRLIPNGFPCKLADCPTGPFLREGSLGFKTQYGLDAYCFGSGEAYWGGAGSPMERARLVVQPMIAVITYAESE